MDFPWVTGAGEGMVTTMATYDITSNDGTILTGRELVSPYQVIVGVGDSIYYLEEKITEMLKRLAPPEYTEVRCRECGGAIDQKWDDHIIKCPYCKTVYVVGRRMMNG